LTKPNLNYEPALHKYCADRSSEELLAANPEGPKRVCLPQLMIDRKLGYSKEMLQSGLYGVEE